ncbi:hypothetical protein [Neochlamydia sp. S13]|uniref:hypothetical protein n=1 Tax=Neochlamydia sp. S13 TaxID=1353976 RepID=UPI0005A83AE9|nr:hypothetical protein [Neochlamydia sp. S13]BBI17702.1 hypothetical protein NCS13_1_1507 [Neochlamydia sp. S13]
MNNLEPKDHVKADFNRIVSKADFQALVNRVDKQEKKLCKYKTRLRECDKEVDDLRDALIVRNEQLMKVNQRLMEMDEKNEIVKNNVKILRAGNNDLAAENDQWKDKDRETQATIKRIEAEKDKTLNRNRELEESITSLAAREESLNKENFLTQ